MLSIFQTGWNPHFYSVAFEPIWDCHHSIAFLVSSLCELLSWLCVLMDGFHVLLLSRYSDLKWHVRCFVPVAAVVTILASLVWNTNQLVLHRVTKHCYTSAWDHDECVAFSSFCSTGRVCGHTASVWPSVMQRFPWRWSGACCRIVTEGWDCGGPERHPHVGTLSYSHSVTWKIGKVHWRLVNGDQWWPFPVWLANGCFLRSAAAVSFIIQLNWSCKVHAHQKVGMCVYSQKLQRKQPFKQPFGDLGDFIAVQNAWENKHIQKKKKRWLFRFFQKMMYMTDTKAQRNCTHRAF